MTWQDERIAVSATSLLCQGSGEKDHSIAMILLANQVNLLNTSQTHHPNRYMSTPLSCIYLNNKQNIESSLFWIREKISFDLKLFLENSYVYLYTNKFSMNIDISFGEPLAGCVWIDIGMISYKIKINSIRCSIKESPRHCFFD